MPDKVVLIKRYNDPWIHRQGCRHLGSHVIGTLSRPLIDLTDEVRYQVACGWLKACKTCRPTAI